MQLENLHRDSLEIRRPLSAERDEIWECLTSRFSLGDSGSVIHFLEQNPFLTGVLLEVREKLDHYFGAETRSSLEVFTDPEDNHSDPKLFALILTTLPSDQASTLLDRLDQEWWLDQPYEVKRLLNIDVEYVDGTV